MKLGKRNKQRAAFMLSRTVLMVPIYVNLYSGLYIQSNLENMLPKTKFGLYREDGLIIFRNFNGRKEIHYQKNVKDIGLNINIKTNLEEVNFLDVTLNLPKKKKKNIAKRSFKSAHRQTILRISSNSYQIASLKDC